VPTRSSRNGAEFVAIGLDHRTAGIDLRERLAFSDDEIPGALRRLTDPADRLLEQAAILSTCNRVELYGVARSRPAERGLSEFLARWHGLDPGEFASRLYVFRGNHTALRLAATAAGLHSLVLGESQIQGQVRKALELALSAGTAGPELRRMFECAAATGRRVRSDTAIGRGATSIPNASVEFARRRLGTLRDSSALVIGTGDTAQLAAKHLAKRGAKELLVLSRTPARAQRLADSCRGQAITSDQLDEALRRSDVVISATGAPEAVLHRDQLRRALACPPAEAEPLLLFDLSVPRDIDPRAAELSGIEIHTIEDLSDTVQRSLVQRRAALPEAYAILGREVARFTDWMHRREAHALRRDSARPATTSGRLGRPARFTRDPTGATRTSSERSC
jgi:glutamyl-tRNA reductase